MRQTGGRKYEWGMAAMLALSFGLTVLGIVRAAAVLNHFEQLVLRHESHEALLASLRSAGLHLLLWGGIVVAGLGMSVLLLVRITGRSRREIQSLRRKNEEMERLNRQTQQLAHHQRLELIGTMTSSIAHEFNNLLTPIMGYSLLALEKTPEQSGEVYEALLEIYQSSRKAKIIISRLSDLSRKNTSDTFREVSLDALTRKALEAAAPAQPEGVEVKLVLNCWERRLRANELQISQMLLNLILNAFHAMEKEGGVLTVSTWYDEDSLFLRVADTGCGIPAEVKPHIFDPFFTTKEQGKGTGLGLAIVAQVVEDHKGAIQVESEPGQGTAFTVTLPRRA